MKVSKAVRRKIEAQFPPTQRPTTVGAVHRMNGLERRYANVLAMLKRIGEIAEYSFEALKFRLADNTWYTPDFVVWLSDGSIQAHEVKGFWRDDARAKIKIAAEMYPRVRFIALQEPDGGWRTEEF